MRKKNFLSITKVRQSEYAQVNRILSSKVNKYNRVIAIKRKFGIFNKSMIFGIKPKLSTCSLLEIKENVVKSQKLFKLPALFVETEIF